MLRRQEAKPKAACVDTLEYRETLGTTARPAEMAEMDSEGTKVIKVTFENMFFSITIPVFFNILSPNLDK